MSEILYLVHRLPYPPSKGDKIRSYHLLRHLLVRHSVHLGCFVDDPADRQHVEELETLCATVFAPDLSRAGATTRSLKGFAGGEALSLPYYFDRAMAAWVDGMLAKRPISAVVAFSSPMAQYVLGPGCAGLRRIMDFVDLDSDKWRQYAARSSLPSKWLYSREARLLEKFEHQVAGEFDAVVFVSENETGTFARQHPASRTKQFTVPNGVATDYFDPELDFGSPFEGGAVPIVFTGMMNYWPNVDAMCWFAREAFPDVRRAVEGAELWIVGAAPDREVLALGHAEGVHVTGPVADVRPYLKHAAVVVAPVRIARGVQNKVLEALAMAKPVVCTPQAASGLWDPASAPVRIAASAGEFVTGIRECLEPEARDALVTRARRYVLDHYDWGRNLARFDALIEPGAAPPAAGAPASATGAAREAAT